jgi:hypothetical protein
MFYVIFGGLNMRSTPLVVVVGFVFASSCAPPPEPSVARWWKGNLHTHSFWSDGDEYPEMIIDWYETEGYDFVALSEHNTLAEGERFIDVASSGGQELLDVYKTRFPDWVEEKEEGGQHLVRLKTLAEYRTLFEEPGSFLLVSSEEITDDYEGKDIHVNATNVRELIEPQGGGSVREVMQNNVDAVVEQRERTGQAMIPHINHPNFGWSIKVEDLIALRGEKFFEVYNGHNAVHNEGDELRPSTERMWDILLAERLSNDEEIMYGLAVDDAHNYHDLDDQHSNPGRGWVMVRSLSLTAEAIVMALEAGDFYGSSGVVLESVSANAEQLSVTIRGEPGVQYRIRFIGTREDYDRSKEEIQVDEASLLYRYSDDIGEVFADVEGTSGSYRFRGDELYVRAKIISNRLMENPYRQGEHEAAWIQPVVRTESTDSEDSSDAPGSP